MDVKECGSEGNCKKSGRESDDDTAKESRAHRQNQVTRSPDGAVHAGATFDGACHKSSLKQAPASSDLSLTSKPTENNNALTFSSSTFETLTTTSSSGLKPSEAETEEMTSGKENNEDDIADDAEKGRADQPKRKKLDRSKLRKGKWTIEEEEYTSRIIHYFSLGFLTLPEGATLRSYIADKLNCDPMRVTKKYAGASCLGRRVFQLREKPQPSIMQIQVARAELDLLEQRFKARVEEGRPGVPLPPQLDLLLAVTQPSHASQVSSVAGLPPWLPSSNVQNAPIAACSEAGLRGTHPLQSLQALAQALTPASAPVASSPLQIHQHGSHQAPLFQSTPGNPVSGAVDGLKLDFALAQILLAQAAASAASQIHVTSTQQLPLPGTNHQPPVFQERTLLPSQAHYGFNAPAKGNSTNFLEELRRTYEQHVATQMVDNGPSTSNFIEHNTVVSTGKAGSDSAGVTSAKATNGLTASSCASKQRLIKTSTHISGSHSSPTSLAKSSKTSDSPTNKAAHKPALPSTAKRVAQKIPSSSTKVKMSVVQNALPKASDDGAILMGFLSSLRNSFQGAIAQQQAERDREQQEDSEETNSSDDRQEQTGRPRRPATVTDSSSQQQESCSSVDESDWNSEDKKTDSSEDLDTDDNQETGEEKYKEAVNYSKGPPRKRHKKSDTLTESRAE